MTALEHLRNLLEAIGEQGTPELRRAAGLARAYLASPPTVDPAVKRWQEVPAEVRRWVYDTMLPHTPSDRWDAGLTAAVALLAAAAGDEEQAVGVAAGSQP